MKDSGGRIGKSAALGLTVGAFFMIFFAEIVLLRYDTILCLTIASPFALALMISAVMLHRDRRSPLVERLELELSSMTDIYITAHELDFVRNTFVELRSGKTALTEKIGASGDDCQRIIRAVMEEYAAPSSRRSVLDFVDFSRLDERLKGRNTITLEFLNANGQWRSARYIVSERLADGGVSRAIYLIEDIDEEKRRRDNLTKALEINNYRLWTVAKIFVTAYDVNLVDDTFEEMKADNKEVADIIGGAHNNAQYLLRKVMSCIADESYMDEVIKFVDFSTLGERLRDTESVMVEYLNHEGAWRRVRFIVSMRNENGEPTRVLWLGQDIDREKKERDRLVDMSERAIAASEAKSAFLSNMSHEIRTPINAVLGLNEMILRESDDANVLAYAESVRTAGGTLLGLINDILDFSKIEAGKMEIIPVDYELSSVINDLVSMIQRKADDKGLALILDFDESTPGLLHGDEVRIKQVVMNILTNAVKYTEKGSVTFHIGYERTPDETDSVYLDVSVRDTGIGIKPEDLRKLFSEFERIEEKRNRNIEGTGLGMNITKSLLEMMGTSLKVESVYGEGSTFSFRVKQKVVRWNPIGNYETAYRAAMSERKKYRERFTAPEATVLVVDDTPMNLMVFKSLLNQTDVRIDMASSGDEGLIFASDRKYDIIFLDHMMPDKDGIETLHEMRARADNPNLRTPAICLTANAISGAREKYLAEGFDDYLTKPIDSAKLEEMLMRYLPATKIKTSAPDETAPENGASDAETPGELEALKGQDWIDIAAGIRNSGSAQAYLPLLKIFYASLGEKADELARLYEARDYPNYTIKVHAIKSSARIIGAAAFGEEAQLLENAGKQEDTDYLRAHHEAFLSKLRFCRKALSKAFEADGGGADRPEADADMMLEALEEIRAAAEEMDCERLEDVFAEMSGRRIPEEYAALWDALSKASGGYDYEGILKLLERGA